MDFSSIARHEEGMLPGVRADVEKYTLIGICRCHDVSKEKQYRLFVSSIKKDIFVDKVPGISVVADPINFSGEIKIFSAIAGGYICRAFPAPVYKRELRKI